MSELVAQAPARPRWDHATILTAMLVFVTTHGRLPTHREYGTQGLPGSSTVYRYCRDFYDALTGEGFVLDRPRQGMHANNPWRRRFPVGKQGRPS